VAQKLLTASRRRTRDRKGKDLEYVRDILESYPEFRPTIAKDLRWLRDRHCPWLGNLRNEIQALFTGSKARGPQWLLPVVYPGGLPEALPMETARNELARPFLELLRFVERLLEDHR